FRPGRVGDVVQIQAISSPREPNIKSEFDIYDYPRFLKLVEIKHNKCPPVVCASTCTHSTFWTKKLMRTIVNTPKIFISGRKACDAGVMQRINHRRFQGGLATTFNCWSRKINDVIDYMYYAIGRFQIGCPDLPLPGGTLIDLSYIIVIPGKKHSLTIFRFIRQRSIPSNQRITEYDSILDDVIPQHIA